jgi:4'-phosphopantetheinyl transferase
VRKQNLTHQIGVDTVWLPQGAILPLRANDVHVWLASLETGEEQYRIFMQTLSKEEMERACRFRFEKDRIRFIATRGILRTLLSGYLNMDAGKVSFVYGPYGKPALSAEACSIPIRFNLAHSHALALFGFAFNCDIGVDIEFMRRDIAMDDIAGRFFSPNEKTALDRLPPDMKKMGFFACWARKEALLKASGKGLSFGLERVEVSVHPELRASVLRIGGSEKDASLWSLHDLPAAPGYAAALAVKGHGFNLCLQQLTAKGITKKCIRKTTP